MIRQINRWDYEQILDIMQAFADATEMKGYDYDQTDRQRAKEILLRCEVGGVSLCKATEAGEIQGVILSLIDQDLWIPRVLRLREVAWWVKPEYRNSTVGAKLFHAYRQRAEELRQQGRIQSYTISRMSFSPEFDFERRGFRHLESTYILGE